MFLEIFCIKWFVCYEYSLIVAGVIIPTVKVEIFALYIISPNSRFFNIRENIYTMRITFIKA